MINNSDPPGSPTMRTVYIRPNYQANDVAPRNTDPAPSRSTGEGVINLINRPTATSGAMESLAKAASAAELPQTPLSGEYPAKSFDRSGASVAIHVPPGFGKK